MERKKNIISPDPTHQKLVKLIENGELRIKETGRVLHIKHDPAKKIYRIFKQKKQDISNKRLEIQQPRT